MMQSKFTDTLPTVPSANFYQRDFRPHIEGRNHELVRM